MDKKVALVTGASSGIGKSTAFELNKMGLTVYGVARHTDRMTDLAEQGIHILSVDVTDDDSMITCVNSILEKDGHIDVLVNNAGYGSYGAIEDVPIEEARRQLDVNLFGLARMIQLVLPSMRKNNYGKIVNISSMGGKFSAPFGGWYHATKFALEGFSDSLRLELKPFGVDVIIVEPGGIKTEWGLIAADSLEKASASGPYAVRTQRISKGMKKMYTGSKLTDPLKVAQIIGKAVSVSRPKTRYVVGYSAKPVVLLKRVLSDRVFDRVINKFLG